MCGGQAFKYERVETIFQGSCQPSGLPKGKRCHRWIFFLSKCFSFLLLRHGWKHGCKWNGWFRRTDEKAESVMNLPKEEWLYFGCLLISPLIPSDVALVDIVENIIWCTYTFCIDGVLSDIMRRLCDICTNQHLHLDLRHVTGVNLKKANKLVLPIKYWLDLTLGKYQLLTLRLFCFKR